MKLFTLFLVALSCFAQQPMVRATSAGAYVLLGKLATANMNSAADQTITINLPTGVTKYTVEKIDVTNCTVSLTLAAGGFYTAASKGGTAIVAAAQVYTALGGTATTVRKKPIPQDTNPTLAVTTSSFTGNMFFSLTTAQGGAATADIYVWGRLLP